MKMKNQRRMDLIIRSSLTMALALAIWSPAQARSAEPGEDKTMPDMPGMVPPKPGEDKMVPPKPGEDKVMPAAMKPGSQAQMNPYFSAINYNLPKDTLMLMALPDFQIARTSPNFFTGMLMAQYGLMDRLTVGVMAEGQKINGLPATYGGVRFNAYSHLFDEHFLNFTLYGEYEGLNKAALYKMEVAGFGGEDLEGPLRKAFHTRVRTFEQRAIAYHDWGRLNTTFNFDSLVRTPF
jgi:hypothetical protein